MVWNAFGQSLESKRSLVQGVNDQSMSFVSCVQCRFLIPNSVTYLLLSQNRYEAIVGAGITVMERVSLPEDYIKDFAMTDREIHKRNERSEYEINSKKHITCLIEQEGGME